MATLDTLNQRLSYIVGENMAMKLKADDVEIDAAALIQGITDIFDGNESALSLEEKERVVDEIQKLSEAESNKEQSCCSDSNCCG